MNITQKDQKSKGGWGAECFLAGGIFNLSRLLPRKFATLRVKRPP